MKRAETGTGCKKFITFSGGNAGVSMTYVASQMNIASHVMVPSFVSERITNRMRSYGAVVQVCDVHHTIEKQKNGKEIVGCTD